MASASQRPPRFQPAVTPLALERHLGLFRLDRIRRIALIVSVLYIPVAFSHLYVLSHGRWLMFGVAAACGTALWGVERWVKRHPERLGSLPWLTTILYAAVVLHSLARLSFAHDAPDMVFVGVLTVALGLVPGNLGQHVVTVIAYVIGWSALIVSAHGAATFAAFVPALVVMVVLSIAIRYMELTRERRFLELQLLDVVRQEQLALESHHDTLTGMPNRELFMVRLREVFEAAGDSDDPRFAVLYLDLDRFKVVNDSLGPQVGDRLLQSIAQRLLRFVRPGDTVARFGGDEFAILLHDLRLPDDALTVAERIHAVLEEPFLLDSYEVQLEASIGIAMYRSDYQSPAEMLRDADIAMYEAKQRSTGQQLFDHEMHARAVERLEIEVDLRRALKGDELRVYYQPIVSLRSGELVGFEALARWQHPDKGLLSPTAFLGPAEETGLIVPLGEWVLEQACRDIRELNDARRRPQPLHVSVNLSAAQFVHSDFMRLLQKTLAKTRVSPETLWLEITETTVLDQPDKAEERIAKLRDLGAEVCVDDFGIGYSSLGYLQRFPFSVIKLDRVFLADDTRNEAIIEAMLTLADGLGMGVVAEGIETPEQAALLDRLGCDLAQGYFFAKPMPFDEAVALVQRNAQLLTMREATATPRKSKALT